MRKRFFVFRFAGILAMLAGVYIMVMSVSNYIDLRQRDNWIPTQAVVEDVSSRISSSRRHRHTSTVYDIDYKYEVSGKVYHGSLKGSNNPMLLGDEIKIKYDPNNTSISTALLNTDVSELLIPLVCGLLFFLMGVLFSGVLPWLKRKIKNSEPEEEFIPTEAEQEAHEKEYGKRPPRSKRTIAVQAVISVMIFAVVAVAALNMFSQPDIVSTDSFSDIMLKNGYTPVDSTEALREDWRVGSLIRKSCSVSTADMRIDFCVLDSYNSAKRLYDGMNLPVNGGDEQTYTNLNYSMTTRENGAIYAVKIRNCDTLIYAAASPEQKENLIDLLRQIGYQKD